MLPVAERAGSYSWLTVLICPAWQLTWHFWIYGCRFSLACILSALNQHRHGSNATRSQFPPTETSCLRQHMQIFCHHCCLPASQQRRVVAALSRQRWPRLARCVHVAASINHSLCTSRLVPLRLDRMTLLQRSDRFRHMHLLRA